MPNNVICFSDILFNLFERYSSNLPPGLVTSFFTTCFVDKMEAYDSPPSNSKNWNVIDVGTKRISIKNEDELLGEFNSPSHWRAHLQYASFL